MKKLKRIYHPYWLWEEIEHNMWGRVTDEKTAINQAIKFTSDHELYGSWMNKVIKQWPVSCENALTDYHMNRKAWLGHAAVAMALKLPESITRKAWRYLTNEQQFLANREASRAIQSWENSYFENQQLQKSMDEPMLC